MGLGPILLPKEKGGLRTHFSEAEKGAGVGRSFLARLRPHESWLLTEFSLLDRYLHKESHMLGGGKTPLARECQVLDSFGL